MYRTEHPYLERTVWIVARKYTRYAEDAVRRNMGPPAIGEGWISETQLFHFLSVSFPDEVIVHQGQPEWLGRQSLDIYFPERNVAVEYQGAQHDRPVEFFGGEQAFLQNQERDLRKRRLCAEAGCNLIEVRPDYDSDAVREEVRLALVSAGLRSDRARSRATHLSGGGR